MTPTKEVRVLQVLGDKGESSQLEKTLPTLREGQSGVLGESAHVVSVGREGAASNGNRGQ